MTQIEQFHAAQPLIKLVVSHVDALTPPERADIYEGLALLLEPLSTAAAHQAQRTCDAIRAAESQQLSFQLLFKESAN